MEMLRKHPGEGSADCTNNLRRNVHLSPSAGQRVPRACRSSIELGSADVDLTAAHWMYLAGVVVINGVCVALKNVVVPAVVASFLTAWIYSGSLVTGLS